MRGDDRLEPFTYRMAKRSGADHPHLGPVGSELVGEHRGIRVVQADDAGILVAWDDDRGRGLNARLVRKLLPGKYWLAVRHKQPGGVGTYDIGVKRRKG